MALFVFKRLTATCRKRTESNSLIDLDIVADYGGFADNDACTVVYEEISADSSSRVDIYTCLAVGVFSHDTRDKRDTEQMELVRDAVYKYCEQSGIREDYLIFVECGGVTLKCSLNVRFDVVSYLRESIQKREC